MMRGETLLILGHGFIGQGQLYPGKEMPRFPLSSWTVAAGGIVFHKHTLIFLFKIVGLSYFSIFHNVTEVLKCGKLF